MKYNPKSYERSLTRFIARQALLVQKLIDEAVSQSVMETERFGVKKGGKEDFFFKDYPGLSRKIDGILHSLTGRMDKVVHSGIEWGWELANTKNDDLVWKVINSIGSTRIPYEAPERWMQKNLPALEAFESRRVNGMDLSDRVWNFTSGIKGDLELALDLGIGEGMSADRLSREVRGYLREPDRLYRRVRDEKGVLRLSESASNYHPGQGVYRSSYKNAKRLTATETNMAYRSADYERNQQLDFVLGIEVHLSNNHTCLNEKGEPEPFFDICDELQGRYPADFKFTGWHPQCRCYTTTILPSQEEMTAYLASMDENGHSDYQFSGRIEDLPPQFKEWVENNADRIEAAEGRGKLPYFIKDNYDEVMGLIGPEEEFKTIYEKDIAFLTENGIITEQGLRSMIGHFDNQTIQSVVASRVDMYAMFGVDGYVKTYGKEDARLITIRGEIDALRGKDEVARLRKIFELKSICGELSAKEIQKWGFAANLEYAGIEKGYLYAEDITRKVNGRMVHTKGMRKDLVLFRSPKSGKEFAYPLGVRQGGITYDIAKIAEFVDNDMPAYLRNNLARVVFINERNPYDSFWAVTYKMPKFESYATDGKEITFWRAVKKSPGSVNTSLLHEAAHAFDHARGITQSNEWLDAVKADIELFKSDKIVDAFPTAYARQAYEGTKGQVVEDFAEALQMKVLWDKEYGEEWFKRCFPNRAKLLEKLISQWPNG